MKCDRCVTDKSECVKCIDNPIYANIPRHTRFQSYIHVCPKGYKDCVNDPAYTKHSDPEWYKEIFGDLTVEEAVMDSCLGGYCRYDDEDK